MLHAFLFPLTMFAIFVAASFLPRRLYSVYEVLSGQYSRRTALWIIVIVAALFSGIFALAEYSYHASL